MQIQNTAELLFFDLGVTWGHGKCNLRVLQSIFKSKIKPILYLNEAI